MGWRRRDRERFDTRTKLLRHPMGVTRLCVEPHRRELLAANPRREIQGAAH